MVKYQPKGVQNIMSFANRLKYARKRQCLTQEQLSKKSGLSTYTIQRYEYGKLNPKKNTVAKLANALGLSYHYTQNGEPYFYDFVDTVESSEYEEAREFNQYQYKDALEKTFNEIKDTESPPGVTSGASAIIKELLEDIEPVRAMFGTDNKKHSKKELDLFCGPGGISLCFPEKIADNIEKLNKQGQEKLYNYSCDLLEIEKYRAKDTSKQETPPPEQNNTAPDTLLAAHQREDIEPTKEGTQHDLDIMNDNSKWE